MDKFKSIRPFLIALIALGSILVFRVLQTMALAVPSQTSLWLGYLAWTSAVVFITIQTFGVWYLYLNYRVRPVPPATAGMSVDVYVVVCGEEDWLIERSVKAAKAITYPHRTFMLDDGRQERSRRIAESMGVEYLTRPDSKNFKAGNLNSALKKTSGEFIAIFDVDHAPTPDFLDRTLGFFEESQVGFVQVMQTFFNATANWVTRAAAEATYEYFNIASVCKDAIDATSLHGSNAVIRRSALDSIGGYQPGLAEDLETSIALHADGWKSRYVCAPLAPGLVPNNLPAFWIQQLKWNYGVLKAALNAVKSGRWSRLSLNQQLAYGIRVSYHLIGVTILLNNICLLIGIFSGSFQLVQQIEIQILLLSLVIFAIRWLMIRNLAVDRRARETIQVLGTSIIVGSWPVYCFALFCVLFGIQLPFMHTPKGATGKTKRVTLQILVLLPQIALHLAMIYAMTFLLKKQDLPSILLFVFILVNFITSSWLLQPTSWAGHQAFHEQMR